MRRTSSIIARRTHSSSISRQAQVIPLTSSSPVPLPQSSPRIRTPASQTPRPSNTEKVKEWIDIFDGPMRPEVFVSPKPTPSPSSAPTSDSGGVSSIVFDGPARPRYIIPAAMTQNSAFSTQSQDRGKPPSPSTAQNTRDVLARSSLPPPRIYDGPAFEWELQTKRV